jgi:hypothetical protein
LSQPNVEDMTITQYNEMKAKHRATRVAAITPPVDNSRCPLSKEGVCTGVDPKRPSYQFACKGNYYKTCDVYKRTLI